MQSISLQSHVGEDGLLKLSVPVGVRDADLEVVIVVNTLSPHNGQPAPQTEGWPPGFFEATYGCLSDEPLAREPLCGYEVREEFL